MAEDVALSRVYSGVHFPSDVLAGARMGVQVADRIRYVNADLIGRIAAQLSAADVAEVRAA